MLAFYCGSYRISLPHFYPTNSLNHHGGKLAAHIKIGVLPTDHYAPLFTNSLLILISLIMFFAGLADPSVS